LLGFDCSMANLDLAAPSAAILPSDDFHALSRAFRPSCNQGRKLSRLVSHLVKFFRINNLQDRPNRTIELPRRKVLIRDA
jgi:hypothetical protein